MDLNALTRWESVGKDLYKRGELGEQLQRLTRLSLAARERERERERRGKEGAEVLLPSPPPVHPQYSANSISALVRANRRLREGREGEGGEGEGAREERALPEEHARHIIILYFTLRRFVKGFCVGFSGRLAFAFLSSLLKTKGKPLLLLSALRGHVLSKETAAYGLFLGALLTLFEQTMRYTHIFKKEGADRAARAEERERGRKTEREGRGGIIKKTPSKVTFKESLTEEMGSLSSSSSPSISSSSSSPTSSPPSSRPSSPPLSAMSPSSKRPSSRLLLLRRLLSLPLLRSLFPSGRLRLSRPSRVILSSSLASLSFFFLPPSIRSSVAVFFFVRALELLALLLHEKGLVPSVPHAEALVMSLSSAQVLYAWLFARASIAPAYLHFLDVQGGQEKRFLAPYVALARTWGDPAALMSDHKVLGEMNGLRAAMNAAPLLISRSPLPGPSVCCSAPSGPYSFSPPSSSLACAIIHPTTASCSVAFLYYLIAAYKRALPVYLPVYVVPLLLFRFRSLLSSPVPTLLQTLRGILRSSLFLSSFTSFAWATACGMARVGLHSPLTGYVCGFVAGFTVLIEKKGRQIELALYVAQHALPSLWRQLQERGVAPHVEGGTFALFSFSLSVIMYAYVIEPHLLRSSYLSLLMFFFGSGSRTASFHTRKQLRSNVLNKKEKEREKEKGKERKRRGSVDDSSVKYSDREDVGEEDSYESDQSNSHLSTINRVASIGKLSHI